MTIHDVKPVSDEMRRRQRRRRYCWSGRARPTRSPSPPTVFRVSPREPYFYRMFPCERSYRISCVPSRISPVSDLDEGTSRRPRRRRCSWSGPARPTRSPSPPSSTSCAEVKSVALLAPGYQTSWVSGITGYQISPQGIRYPVSIRYPNAISLGTSLRKSRAPP